MTIADIETVFGTAKYLENGFPGEERPSEWEYIYDGLRGKHWHDLTIADLDAQCGVDEGISCLSADTFVYFLPGIMNLALNDSATRCCIVYGIASRLTRQDCDSQYYQSKARGHKRKREQKMLDREYARILQVRLADEKLMFASLSPRQRQSVAQFLRDALQHEPTLCPVVVNSAIHNLEQGKIEEYRHEEVSRWAEQFKSKGQPMGNDSRR